MQVSRKLTKILLPTGLCAEQHNDSLQASKNVAKSKYFEIALNNKGGCQKKRRDCIQRLLTIIPVRSESCIECSKSRGPRPHCNKLLFSITNSLSPPIFGRFQEHSRDFKSEKKKNITTVQAKEWYSCYNNIVLTTNTYMSKFRPSLSHHQGALQYV